MGCGKPIFEQVGDDFEGGIAFSLLVVTLFGVTCLEVTVFPNALHPESQKNENNFEEYYSTGCYFSVLLMLCNYAINDNIVNDRAKGAIGRHYALKGST